jgi:hypothetical protein
LGFRFQRTDLHLKNITATRFFILPLHFNWEYFVKLALICQDKSYIFIMMTFAEYVMLHDATEGQIDEAFEFRVQKPGIKGMLGFGVPTLTPLARLGNAKHAKMVTFAAQKVLEQHLKSGGTNVKKIIVNIAGVEPDAFDISVIDSGDNITKYTGSKGIYTQVASPAQPKAVARELPQSAQPKAVARELPQPGTIPVAPQRRKKPGNVADFDAARRAFTDPSRQSWHGNPWQG